MEYNIIGIDVSKATLEGYFLSTGERKTFSNNKNGFELFYKQLQTSDEHRIFMESTGCYHIPLERFLSGRGLSVFVVNPQRVRSFAKAHGKLAKTDRLDAEMIAQFGKAIAMKEKTIVSAQTQQKLQSLSRRREQLVMLLSMEKNHAEKANFCQENDIMPSLKGIRRNIESHLKKIELQITSLVRSDHLLKKLCDALMTVTGVGRVTAVTMIAELPELGLIGKRQIAPLAGLAPMCNDSGAVRGQRHIQGGRKAVRRALYMAIVSAIQHNHVIKTYYNRLREAGKSVKWAMTACMRKMLVHLNSIAANILGGIIHMDFPGGCVSSLRDLET